MKYSIYKMEFRTAVHFGEGMLSSSGTAFGAGQLFSAMFIEALKAGMEQELLVACRSGSLLFSDAFPYIGDKLLVPKPMVYVDAADRGDSVVKKKFKRMNYLPYNQIPLFLAGKMSAPDTALEQFGVSSSVDHVAIRTGEDTLPYHIGTFRFYPDCGLYVICAASGDEAANLFSELIESVSYTGIGGKKASGYGKFSVKRMQVPAQLQQMLQAATGRYLLLSEACPTDPELDEALSGASYLLERKSGFVASERYAEDQQKKRDLYVMKAGSCFRNHFEGDVFDVNDGGSHPVYRYAKPLFMGV